MKRGLAWTGVAVLALGLRPAAAGEFVDGVPWIGLAGSDTGFGISGTADTWVYGLPDLKLDAAGNPVVVWGEGTDSTSKEIWLRRWNGSAWVELGGSASGGGISGTPDPAVTSSYPKLALTRAGDPVVAWQEGFSIWMKGWSGTAWVEYGTSATGAGLSGPGTYYAPRLGLDLQDRPVVMYSGLGGGVYCRRWDGTGWIDVGSQPVVTGPGAVASSSWAGTLNPSGNPAIAYSDTAYNVRYLEWNGSSWVGLAGSDGPDGLSPGSFSGGLMALAFDPKGRPGVAWRDASWAANGGWYETYFRRWDGTAWVELGGSATGPGVSGTPDATINLSLAFDPTGDPGIAWQDYGGFGSTNVLRFRRWNGTAWVEQSGSASGAGLEYGGYLMPSLAFDAAGCPAIAYPVQVAAGNPNSDVRFRRIPGLPPSKLRQFAADGSTPIPPGGQSGSTAVFACGSLPMAGDYQLEVDVAGPGLTFDGIAEAASGSVAADAPAAASWYAGTPGEYRWRARLTTALGIPQTPWVEFGPVPSEGPDYVVAEPAPPPEDAPPGTGGSKRTFKTGCSAAAASSGFAAAWTIALVALLGLRGSAR